jgi:hypothetical protein
MDFEYEYEAYDDMTREELEQLADDLASGRNSEVYDEIINNISIIPTVENVSPDED